MGAVFADQGLAVSGVSLDHELPLVVDPPRRLLGREREPHTVGLSTRKNRGRKWRQNLFCNSAENWHGCAGQNHQCGKHDDFHRLHMQIIEPAWEQVRGVPDAALAVKVIVVVSLNEREHVVPQLIPAGEDLTVPEPVPVLVTVNVSVVAETCSAGTTTNDNETTTIAEIKLRGRPTCSVWLTQA